MMNASVEIRNQWLESLTTFVTAIQPAKATAAWPEGRPPRSGVPRPVQAFVAITKSTVTTSATNVSSAGAPRVPGVRGEPRGGGRKAEQEGPGRAAVTGP